MRRPRRAGRQLRRSARQARKRARGWRKQAAHALLQESGYAWRYGRRTRLRLGLHRDPIERMLDALDRTLGAVAFVQIGANDGVHGDPIHLFARTRSWHGVMAEPGPVFDRLQANCGDLAGVRLERAAIAKEPGIRELFVLDGAAPALRASVHSSFSKGVVSSRAAAIGGIEDCITSIPVPCISFEQLCERAGLEDPNLVVIDTEGHDFEILKSIDLKRFRPALFVYEHYHLNAGDREACRRRLQEHGYRVLQLQPTRFSSGIDTLAITREALEQPVIRRAWERVQPRTPRAPA